MRRCGTAQLEVTMATGRGGAAAGSYSKTLAFRNVSSRTCTMYGYPGVSFVGGGTGRQVNDPFGRRSEAAPALVTLAPGGAAYVQVLFPSVDNYEPPTCRPVPVDGYRVYPPDETEAVFVADPQRACSAQGTGVPQLWPARPTAGS